MTALHQIKPEELLELVLGYEFQTPVTFSEFTESFALYRELTPTQVTDKEGASAGHTDLTAATCLLRSLDEAGYVIVRKESANNIVTTKSAYDVAVENGYKGTREDFVKKPEELLKFVLNLP